MRLDGRAARRRTTTRAGVAAVLLGLACACPKTSPDAAGAGPAWKPGAVVALPDTAGPRGLVEQRGVIHAHTVYSHDACDGKPTSDAGVPDPACFDDFRRGLCVTQHDFVLLSDHPAFFADAEFPAVLLYRPDLGDVLVERAGQPVANRLMCVDGHTVLVMAGTESTTMPVGLERHIGATPEQRRDAYGAATAESVQVFKDAGAVSLVMHTEDWTAEQLVAVPFDGFEMYNLHANMMSRIGEVLTLVVRAANGDPGVPHPDLMLVPLFYEDPRYLDTWAAVLHSGARRVTTLGTDCHQNTITGIQSDGERGDGYRRMMSWFSNHLLVRPRADGTWDDQQVKEALRAGRSFGAFEYLGYPLGFDFHALEGGSVREMGEQASIARGVELVVDAPALAQLDPGAAPPVITTRLLRATAAGWEVAAEGGTRLRTAVAAPGAYRAEVRMKPHHLDAWLGTDAATLRESDRVWVYSNPVYVVE